MQQDIRLKKQLMLDFETSEIVEPPPKYVKEISEVPEHIKNFINSTFNSLVIFDESTNQYCCLKCFKELDSMNCCSNCSIQYEIPSVVDSKYVIKKNADSLQNYNEAITFFSFDIQEDNILLYVVVTNIRYHNNFLIDPINNTRIKNVFHVTNKGLTDLLTSKLFLYEQYHLDDTLDNIESDTFDMFTCQFDNEFLYTDNLVLLQNTEEYKYSRIWELQDYLKKEKFTLLSLTYHPIYVKQFEYLVKMKLYRLAITAPEYIKYQKSFQQTFGVEKKHYDFMKENDISFSELEALRLCQNQDKDLLNYVEKHIFLFEKLIEYAVPKKIKNYLEQQKLEEHYIFEYYDYVNCCKQIGLNLKDKRVLFPKDLVNQHNKIILEVEISKDPKINAKIMERAKLLKINMYEDEKYVIFPACSIESLIDESAQLSNCVRTYGPRVSSNECQIYFMRNKSDIKKSLVTIEVKNGKIVQARTKFNNLPDAEIDSVLKKWERQLTPIVKW